MGGYHENIYKWVMRVAVFLLFLISITSFLDHRYITKGDCAAIVYYVPLSLEDYCTMTFLACTTIGLSCLLNRRYISKTSLIIEVLIYAIIVAIVCVYGNHYLASAEFDWPHTYHPIPYLK